MPRRGRCRCGHLLVFHRGPQGYKMRCPQCLAVVRLQVGPPNTSTPSTSGPTPQELDISSFAATQFLDLDEIDPKSRRVR
jgi:hypothetical protein